jgi:serine/threonine-protein kinase/endoribonuclease IRE1
MGLGKQLLGHSSYGSAFNNSSLRGESNGAQSSIIGIGPGSVGWQAPEVMALRTPSDITAKSGDMSNSNDTGSDFSPMDVPSTNRTSRSVDIFSLGCVFYSTILPGSHPFGEWYEREANIMHNRPNLQSLEALSLEAHDLIGAMLQRSPSARPTAKQISGHPFFWSSDRRLSLLCDLSDRIEQDAVNAGCSDPPDSSFAAKLLVVEKNALKVVGMAWDLFLDPDLIRNVQRFRTYDSSSARDLLRLIRNKYHHFDELPDAFRAGIGSKTEGLVDYFDEKFPRYVCANAPTSWSTEFGSLLTLFQDYFFIVTMFVKQFFLRMMIYQ